jgi:DNA-binding MarR family transcriptional regulator/N-acetylglutamate synthase-like GNAT family acetyltransferase
MCAQSLTTASGSLRHFNRFYTAQIGVLDRDLLGSGHSLAEARILYELAMKDGVTASDLAEMLSMDRGYISRVLARFERGGLIERERSPNDGRVQFLVLTGKGRQTFANLDALSQNATESMLSPLSDGERDELLGALRRIEATLAPRQPTQEITLREHRVGDMGWIVHRQSVLYAREYGWNGDYETLVFEIIARFLRDFDAAGEKCWVAERSGEVVGSVFVVRDTDSIARLRLLYVEPSARSLGVGQRLVEQCISFAKEKGYERIDLWTNSVLNSARRIYEKAGFYLVREEPHHSFGKDLVGQHWSLELG